VKAVSAVFVSQRWRWGGAEDVRGERAERWWYSGDGGGLRTGQDNYGAGLDGCLAWPLTGSWTGKAPSSAES
jgi:hypothetical protein